MIVSHKHKFIFFKTRKTAGTSIQVALSKFCDPEQDIITGVNSKDGVVDTAHSAGWNTGKFCSSHPHPTLKQVRAFLGEEIWNSYYKFAFVRNPYDIAVSRYHWNLKGKLGVTDTSIEGFRKWVSDGSMFREDSAKLYIVDKEEIVLDFIGRYENLEQDLSHVFNKLNLQRTELPKFKSGFRDNTSYIKFYDEETKRKVHDFYLEDFKLLDYSFYKRFKLEKHKQPILSITGETGGNINGPSVIKVPNFIKDKLGKYYLYFAHHKGTNIRLAYSDSIEGPWKIHKEGTLQLSDTVCKDHIASPDVHITDNSIKMFFHGDHPNGQSTFVAESSDGINFKASGTPTTPFYHREFNYLGDTYAICKNSNTNSIIYKKVGQDYIKEFELLPKSRHTAILTEGNELSIFYSLVEEAPERIYVLKIIDWEVVDNYELTRPEIEFEGSLQPLVQSKFGMALGFSNQLRDPCIFQDEDKRYMFYCYGGESGITFGELL